MQQIQRLTQKYKQQLVLHRRILHRLAENGLEEYQTAKYVRIYLEQFSCVEVDQMEKQLPTAIIARINIDSSLPRFLFRCELDALLLKQESDLEFKSIGSYHHACGHDAHMASLLVLIKVVAQNLILLKYNLVICFQPGEEGKGGAQKLFHVKPKLLSSIQHSFAIHLANNHIVGQIMLSEGFITANSTRFTIKIKGKSSHCLAPHAGVDAIFTGCTIVNQLYTLKQLWVDPMIPFSLTVIKIQGGSDIIQVANTCIIQGTLRTIGESFNHQIESIVKNICLLHGASGQVVFAPSFYRSVKNDPKLTNKIKRILQSQTRLILNSKQTSLAGQDFCQFSERIQSCYLSVGSAQKGSINQITNQSIYPSHTNRHKIDQSCLQVCLQIWLLLAFTL